MEWSGVEWSGVEWSGVEWSDAGWNVLVGGNENTESFVALGTSVRTTTNLLVLLVSSSGVILQLASNRYPFLHSFFYSLTHSFVFVFIIILTLHMYQVNTYRLFFSDKIINIMMGMLNPSLYPSFSFC